MSFNSLKQTKKFKIVISTIVLFIATIFAVAYVQYKSIELEYSQNIRTELSQVEGNILEVDNKWGLATDSYDKLIQSKADTLAYVFRNVPQYNYYQLARDSKDYMVDNIMIVDRNGNIVARGKETQADFKKPIFNQLRECFKYSTDSTGVSVKYLNGESYLYYSSAIDSERMVVVEVFSSTLEELVKEFSSWKNVLKNVSVGTSGTVLAVSNLTYMIGYDSDDIYTGKDALELGLRADDIKDDFSGWINLDNRRYFAGIKEIDDAYIVCMVPLTEIIVRMTGVTIFILIFILAIISMMLIYAVLIMGHSRSVNKYVKLRTFLGNVLFNRTLGRRLSAIVIIGIVGIFYLTLYAQTLLSLSNNSITSERYIVKIREYIDDYLGDYEAESNYYDEAYFNKISIASKIVSDMMDRIDSVKLSELSRVIGVDAIDVFDKSGRVIVSTDDNLGYYLSTASDDDESILLRRYLNNRGTYVLDPAYDEWGDYVQYGVASLYDNTRGIVGLIRTKQNTENREKILAGASMHSILGSVITDNATECIAIEKDTLKVEYIEDVRLKGRQAQNIGIAEKVLTDGYDGYIYIMNEQYFANVTESNGYYIIVATPVSKLNSSHMSVSLKVTLLCTIALFILFILLCVTRDKKSELDGNELSVINDKFKEYQSASMRWRNKRLKWVEQTPEQQLFTVISDTISFIAILVTISVFIINETGDKDSIIVYILSGHWERGLNIFSLTASLIAISIGFVVQIFIKRILEMLSDSLNARGTTICRMLGSSVKYIIFFVVAFYCLRLYGVNPSTLLASAGVMSVVIGLGANTLMSDIIAGIFLIFEGEFRVGDIVTIDDFRGVVLDIGIRTTKIEDDYHNIKIISNSKVSGILNMTKKISYAEIFVSIDYGESLERVEGIFKIEFPLIKERLDRIKGDLFYTNVSALGDNGVILRILAECDEAERPQAIRDLNREMKLLFDKYNINVPYPQITINEQIDYSKRKVEEISKTE